MNKKQIPFDLRSTRSMRLEGRPSRRMLRVLLRACPELVERRNGCWTHTSGFTLIAVLVFLQIFALLGLFAMMRTTVDMKENSHRLVMQDIRAKARQFLQQLEKMNIHQWHSCLISTQAAASLASQPEDWWQQKSCHRTQGSQQYYYTLESLEIDSCALIQANGKPAHSGVPVEKSVKSVGTAAAHYYRITLLALSAKLENARYFIQSTIALPEASAVTCAGKRRTINRGPQMRREI